MHKIKVNRILISCALFCCLPTVALKAESPQTDVSMNEETTIPDSEWQTLQLEQNELGRTEVSSSSIELEKPTRTSVGKGKSILNFTKTDLTTLANSSKTPKTSFEAESLGWKRKTVNTPRPVSGLIKEVPKEIEAKKAKLKNMPSKDTTTQGQNTERTFK